MDIAYLEFVDEERVFGFSEYGIYVGQNGIASIVEEDDGTILITHDDGRTDTSVKWNRVREWDQA